MLSPGFFLDGIKSFGVSSQLFDSYTEQMRGPPVTVQWLSKWITSCIVMCYKALCPHGNILGLMVLVGHIPIVDSCRAAMQSSVHIFARGYVINTAPRKECKCRESGPSSNETPRPTASKTAWDSPSVMEVCNHFKKKKELFASHNCCSFKMSCICPLHDPPSFPSALESII